MSKVLTKRGQSTLEYAVLIVVIIAALIAMQVYLKRGIQGGLREKSDQIGDQYSPGYTTTNMTTTTYSHTRDTSWTLGSTTQILNQFQNRFGWENVMASANEYWGK